MQKKVSFITIILFTIFLSGCCLVHDWKDATCEEPRTCKVCGETEGEALGHDFDVATCTLPETCKVCGAIKGEPLGHAWKEATCQNLRTCVVCGATEGDFAGHEWVEATCLRPKHCVVCGMSEGYTKSHVWVKASYTSAAYCAECGIVEGDTLVPAFEKRNYTYTLEKRTEWTYTTIANADNSPVNATAKIIDYRKYKSDGAHYARDGYEWREVTIEFVSKTGIKVMFGHTDTYAGLEEYPQGDYITYPDGTMLPIIAVEDFRYEWKNADGTKPTPTPTPTPATAGNDANSTTSGTDNNATGTTDTNATAATVTPTPASSEGDTCFSYGTLAVQVPEDYENLVLYVCSADYANTGRIDPNIRFMEMK